MKLTRRFFHAALAVAGVGLLWSAGVMPAAAQTTNVITWRASLTGTLGIQEYRATLAPYLNAARFNSADFIRMVVGAAPTTTQTLALNVEVINGVTNLYFSLYDTVNRVQSSRLTTNETSLLFQDGTNFAAIADMPVNGGGTNAVSGLLRIAVNGREARGIPATFNGTMHGFLVDPRTGDGGTTGLVMRATLTAGGAPLKVQPALP